MAISFYEGSAPGDRTLSRILVITIVLAAAACLLCVMISSDSSDADVNGGTSGGIDWTLDDGELIITPAENPESGYDSGVMPDYSSCGPWGTGVTSVIINAGVTHIGIKAFDGCSSLKSISFPSSLDSVGDGAFEGFTFKTLNDVALDATASNLRGHNFALREGTEKVLYMVSGKAGFLVSWSYDLSTDTLTISGRDAMDNYSAGDPAPWGTVKHLVVESGITWIGAYAFYNCTKLESVSIADSVTNINNYAFAVCTSLTGLNFGAIGNCVETV